MLQSGNGPLRRQNSISGKILTQPLSLEDGKVPGLLRNMTYVACLIIGAAIFWASVSEIRELAIGRGEIVPADSVKSVHHLEGGIIGRVLIQEGQIVDQGAAILRLHPIAGNSDLEQLKVRQASLGFKKQRLLALLNGNKFTPNENAGQFPKLFNEQLELLKLQLAVIDREKKTLQARINQRTANVDAYDRELESFKRQLALKKERAETAENLYNKKIGTRSVLLALKSEYEETLALSISLGGRQIAAREALEEARSQLLETELRSRQIYTEELTKTSTELAAVTQNIVKQKDKVDRLVVRSPVHGIVQLLPFHTKGEVVKPGELVAKIVPVDENVVAEIRLDPKDIGHVKVGDTAELKISTFDSNVFGVANGKVDNISASSFISDRGDVYFKATIKLADNTIGSAGQIHKITPGMLLQANIVTGSKSLIQYMLKPVYRSLDTAFTER